MYKKTLLNEINRNREIMGMNPLDESTFMVTEQSEPSFGSKERVKVDTKTSTESLKIDVGKNNFEQGKYKFTSLSNDSQNKITTDVARVIDFLNENPNSKITINLEVGESAVTNYDREKCKNGDYSSNCRMNPGDLAKKRAETLFNFIKKQFDPYISKGVVVIPEPKTNVELGKQKHTYTKGVDKPHDRKYFEDQYINFNISVESTKTEDVYEDMCLVNFEIDVSYRKRKNDEFPCRGGHRCDEAKFSVFLNETQIGIANLNNAKEGNDPGGDRTAILKVTPELVEKIIKGDYFRENKRIVLMTRCLSSNCHTSTQEVKLTNKKGEILYHQCVNPEAKRGSKDVKVLAVMDECGNVIENYTATKSEIEQLADTASDNKKLKDRLGSQEELDSFKSEEQRLFAEKVDNNENVIIFTNSVLSDIIFNKSVMKVIDNKLENGKLILTVRNESDSTYDARLGLDGESQVYGIKPGQELKTSLGYKEIKVDEKSESRFFNTLKYDYSEGEPKEIIKVTEGPFVGYYFFKQGKNKSMAAFGESQGVIPDNEYAQNRTVVNSNSVIKVTIISKKNNKKKSTVRF